MYEKETHHYKAGSACSRASVCRARREALSWVWPTVEWCSPAGEVRRAYLGSQGPLWRTSSWASRQPHRSSGDFRSPRAARATSERRLAHLDRGAQMSERRLTGCASSPPRCGQYLPTPGRSPSFSRGSDKMVARRRRGTSRLSPRRHSPPDCHSSPYTQATKVAARDAFGETKAGTSRLMAFASFSPVGVGRPPGVGRPVGSTPSYRVICSPAVAEITGDGRPWTVSMISALSMPCR